MKHNRITARDERATFIENVSFKFGYNLVTFALLFDVIYRGFIYDEAAWDLLGIIILSGFVMMLYQYKQKILDKSWLKTVVVSSFMAFIVAILITVIIKIF
ncbi:MAG: hypothetical protein K0S47_3106 [Herbinix sp.]|jgi:hypothetical protein|nr:hypothetical protein [Herbinix sp.]